MPNIREIYEIIMMLKAAYPAFYSKYGREELEATAKTWRLAFADVDFTVLEAAAIETIRCHTGYPPTIGEIMEKVREIRGDQSDEELWLILRDAASRGLYGAREEFEKLPAVLKRYCGSPSALRDMAREDAERMNTVTRGQFLKSVGAMRRREDYAQMLPGGAKAETAQIAPRS